MRSPRRSLVRTIPITILALTVSCSSSGSAGPDTQPPVFAGATAAITINDDAIILQWNAAMDTRTPAAQIVYRIYIAVVSGGQNFLTPDATTPAGVLQFTAGSLTANTTYFFVVRAVDTAGNEDLNTAQVSATTLAAPDTVPPSFGGATGALATSEFTIDVSWTPATDAVTPQALITYNAYASTSMGGQNFTSPSVTSAPGATSLVVGGLLPTTTYFIVVRAEDAVGNEDTNTNEVSDTTLTPDTTPPVFGGVQTAVSMNPTRVNLGWISATDNRASPAQIIYKVYWASTSGGQNFGSPNAITGPGVVTFTATGLLPNTDHYFVVRAQDPSGNQDTNTVEILEKTMVSFGGNVLGIFTSTCGSSGCHGQMTPAVGLELWNYSVVFNTAINIPAQQASMDNIEPFSSTQSYLQHKIDNTHGSVGGSGVEMPPAMLLPPASRNMVRDWINQGALDN